MNDVFMLQPALMIHLQHLSICVLSTLQRAPYGVLWAITINKCQDKANSDRLMGEKSIDEYIIQDTNRKNGVYDDNNDIISKNSPTQKVEREYKTAYPR